MSCHISNQIAEFADLDSEAKTCPDCGELVDEIFNGLETSYICPSCEIEVEYEDDL